MTYNYKQVQIKAKHIIDRAKREEWENWSKNIGNSTSSRAWNIVKKFKGKTFLENKTNIFYNPYPSNKIMDVLCPAYAPNQHEITIPIFQCPTDHLEASFNYNKLITAIKSKKKSTVPGLDGIRSCIMIKKLPNNSLELLKYF